MSTGDGIYKPGKARCLIVHINMCIIKCMRTNIVLDDKLMAEAHKLTGIKTKKALIDVALKTLIELNKRKSLLSLKGKIDFFPGYSYKSLRKS